MARPIYAPALPPPGQRIALASDQAFSFVYPHLIEAWRRAGAEIFAFSPLADEPPPESADSCWLPGGYPELHADALAAARRFSAGLRRFAETRPVHGECGGYMVLGESLEDAAGRRHAMTGLLGHATSFARASCISATARRGFWRTVCSAAAELSSAATNSITPRSLPLDATSHSPS